ncbi:MAG: HEAT repeat domain-containing protein [Planctomycetota bacterium]
MSPRPPRTQPPDAQPTRARVVGKRLEQANTACLVAGLAALTLAGCGAYDQITENDGTGRRSDSLLAGVFAGPSPTQAVVWSIDELNADNRYRGTILLANAPYAGEDVYLELFRDNMDPESEPYAIVRAAAVRGLAHHGLPDQDVPRLIDLYDRDTAPTVRAEIVRALQRLHNPLAIRTLIRIAGDLDLSPRLRADATDALAQYPEPRVFEALVDLLRDDSLLVNERAHAALITLTGETFDPVPTDWLVFARDADDPFAARRRYEYPVFERGLKYYEYLPLIPDPPNEPPSTPAGFPEPELTPELTPEPAPKPSPEGATDRVGRTAYQSSRVRTV